MRRVLLLIVIAVGVSSTAVAQTSAPRPEPAGDAAYYFILGRHLEGDGKIDEAIEAHKRAIALAPDSAEPRAELAGLYARQNRAREALDMAQEALQHDPSNVEANRILGTVYAAMADQRQPLNPGDNPAEYAGRAISALEKARAGSFDVNVELMLGRLYVQTGAFDKAIDPLRRVVDDQPGFPDAAFLLAAAQEGAGQPDAAVATLQKALAENPGFYRGQVRLAEIYERQQRWRQAADAYAKAQSLNSRATDLTTRRAATLINGGLAAEARDILQGALQKPGSAAQNSVLLYLLAEAERALHDLSAAEATARKLLAASPEDLRGLHVLSLVLQEKGDFKAAESVQRDLIGREPQNANAQNSLGYLLAERGQSLDEAVELLQRALKIEPANPSYLDSLGWAYFQQGRLELADPPLTEAANKLQDSSVVQEHLGDLRFKQQRYADAAAAWERALAGDGQSIDRTRIEKKIRDARSRMEER